MSNENEMRSEVYSKSSTQEIHRIADEHFEKSWSEEGFYSFRILWRELDPECSCTPDAVLNFYAENFDCFKCTVGHMYAAFQVYKDPILPEKLGIYYLGEELYE